MRRYPKALKRKLLDTICQMREELPKYTADPKRDITILTVKCTASSRVFFRIAAKAVRMGR